MASLADVSRAIMRSANTAPKLTVADEKALLQRVQADDDVAALDRLSQSNLRRVLSMANGLRGYGLPLDDLVQEGCIGMTMAARRYDLDQDLPFGAYARHWIKHEMRDFIVRNWSLVRAASGSAEEKLFFKLRAVRAKLEAEPGATRATVTNEIAAAFGVSYASDEGRLAVDGLGGDLMGLRLARPIHEAVFGVGFLVFGLLPASGFCRRFSVGLSCTDDRVGGNGRVVGALPRRSGTAAIEGRCEAADEVGLWA